MGIQERTAGPQLDEWSERLFLDKIMDPGFNIKNTTRCMFILALAALCTAIAKPFM